MKTTQQKQNQLWLALGNNQTRHLETAKREVVLQILARAILQAFEEASREVN